MAKSTKRQDIYIANGRGSGKWHEIESFDVSEYGLAIQLQGVYVRIAGPYAMYQIRERLQMVEDADEGKRARARRKAK